MLTPPLLVLVLVLHEVLPPPLPPLVLLLVLHALLLPPLPPLVLREVLPPPLPLLLVLLLLLLPLLLQGWLSLTCPERQQAVRHDPRCAAK